MLRTTATSGLTPEAADGDVRVGEARSPLKSFCRSAAGFWGARGDRSSWLFSAILLAIVLLNLGAAYGMNVWNRVIFDALQAMDADQVLRIALLYLPLLAGSVLISVMHLCTRMTMQRRWRAWLNRLLIDRWLGNGRYYQLDLVGGAPGNPECRIADDLRIATEAPIELLTGATSALLSAATFIMVLWTVGGAFTVHVGGAALTIPGFLVLAAVIYAVAASGCMLVIGRRLITVSESRNQAEAEYRYGLTRVRENGEAIALLHGDEEERRHVQKSFATVLRAWRDVCIQSMRTEVVSRTSGYITPILPILLCAPKFLDQAMTLGELMQAASAFTMVQSALNWLVDNYARLADWAAAARRVGALKLSLDALDREERQVSRIARGEGKEAALRLRQVAVLRHDGAPVIDGADVAVMPGQKLLITGHSGNGKSTLARAIAGVWPWGRGAIEVGAGAKLSVLPQRPYVPLGTLRRAVTYPDAAESRSVEEIFGILEKVGLGHLSAQLDADGPWDQILSGGEKQRLAFARLLLHRPDIIVLDEATAALDSPSQARVMALLSRELEAATVVSIGHRPELAAFHDSEIALVRGRSGARLVGDGLRGAQRRHTGHRPVPAELNHRDIALLHDRSGLRLAEAFRLPRAGSLAPTPASSSAA
jgi:vitamin B12/bleomycin/antimicrobial peptide transport system ATP-binding/permease protein